MEGGNPAKRPKSSKIDEIPTHYDFEEDSNKKFDEGTTTVQSDDDSDEFSSNYDSDDEIKQCVDEIMHGGTAQKELEVLAAMVGAKGFKPEDVLSRVISVVALLKGIEEELLKEAERVKPKK